ncbi:hypothetical protein JB92DRAFT_2833211 [Gautieria morchelliformis]|nr:hypothetical protein JB92DRAFT_2833211 [Gautieria morchelliformis]
MQPAHCTHCAVRSSRQWPCFFAWQAESQYPNPTHQYHTTDGDSCQTYRGDKVEQRRTSRVNAIVRLAISAERSKAGATIQVTAMCRVAAAFCLAMIELLETRGLSAWGDEKFKMHANLSGVDRAASANLVHQTNASCWTPFSIQLPSNVCQDSRGTKVQNYTTVVNPGMD